MKINFSEFDNIYQRNVKNIMTFCTRGMQQKIAFHNKGWSEPYSFDNYLKKSSIRFYKAYQNIPEDCKHCCDIGGFWGIFPIVLNELGYNVTMTEALKYYDSTFEKLFTHITNEGVQIIDIDPFIEDFKDNNFDFISIMAVLEHIPNSISFFLNNIINVLNKQNGTIYIEVPNIAYYFKRISLLKGISPLPNIETILDSSIPFTGHHHEYSLSEVYSLFNRMQLNVKNFEKYNYSLGNSLSTTLKYLFPILIMKLFPNTRECLAICGNNKQ